MRLDSQHVYIRRLETEDVEDLLDLQVRNRDFLRPFEPVRRDAYFTLQGQLEMLEKVQSDWQEDMGYGFGIFPTDNNQLIGRVNLSNIVRGAWESSTIGYFLDHAFNNRGYTTAAVRLAVGFAFEHAKLHRVQAAVMPRNSGSIRVLEKAGFQYDGSSEYYLQINGVWEDHNLYSITQERW